MKARDLTGLKFGILTALRRGTNTRSTSGRSLTSWICECDCGVIKSINTSNLTKGLVNSCGCVRDKKSSDRLKINRKDVKFEKGMASFNILYSKYKTSAIKRDRTFTLTKDEFRILTSSSCYYCGISPSQSIQGKRTNGAYEYNGIDREDNEEGYEYWNCVTCCSTCNYAKKALSQGDFYKWVDRLIKYQTKK